MTSIETCSQIGIAICTPLLVAVIALSFRLSDVIRKRNELALANKELKTLIEFKRTFDHRTLDKPNE